MATSGRPGPPEPKPARFVWPPRTPGTPSGTPPPTTPATPQSASRGVHSIPADSRPSWWQSIERTWLGLLRPSLPERIAEACWIPDGPADHCHRCGISLGPGQAEHLAAAGCPRCREDPTPWSRITRLGRFEGVLRDAVLEAKFERNHVAVTMLGRLLAESLAAALLSEGRSPLDAVLVPIPTTRWRTFRRGIDHSGRLATQVGRLLTIPTAKLLTRRNGRAQVGLSAASRRRNVHGTMTGSATNRPLIILVDDVITTGATLREACRALLAAVPPESHAEPPAECAAGQATELWALVAGAAEIT